MLTLSLADTADTADAETGLRQDLLRWLASSVGKEPLTATAHDWYLAMAQALRERMVSRWMRTIERQHQRSDRRVYYLSMEIMTGRLLGSALASLGLDRTARVILDDYGVDMQAVMACEPEAPLGDSGQGRLAACLLDGMASHGLPGFGYGLRYEYGAFRQQVVDGWQVEVPESWLQHTNPWAFERGEIVHPVSFYGQVDAAGRWTDGTRVWALAHDTPLVGWKGRWINTLRLWSAEPDASFDLAAFNRGEHVAAMAGREQAAALTRVLYPAGESDAGRELRLMQQYFLATASLQDVLRRHLKRTDDVAGLPAKATVHLNGSHSAIAVAELQRLLVDHHGFDWDRAWDVTRQCFTYTAHSLLPEGQERWPLALLGRVLPRHRQIVERLDGALAAVAAPDTLAVSAATGQALIDRSTGSDPEPVLRLGHLAFHGSTRVNGVSEMQTRLLRTRIFPDLDRVYPDRLVAITNGVTPRRWLDQCNRPLARLITETIGDGWVDDLGRLSQLLPLSEDAGFRDAFATARQTAKDALADYIARTTAVDVDPAALFDVQIKPIHGHKRQLMNLLHAAALYEAIRVGDGQHFAPRVKILAGKASPADPFGGLIVKLAHALARRINTDPAVGDRLKLVFLPDYGVTLAERVIPAADLSVQISTPGTESSGTGNMKLALNGALTLGSRDGANLEICDRVGDASIFLFGPAVEDADYDSAPLSPAAIADLLAHDDALRAAIGRVAYGLCADDEPGDLFRPLIHQMLSAATYRVLRDFAAFADAQARAEALWRNPASWWHHAVRNTALTGWFSVDRAVAAYAAHSWHTGAADLSIAAE